MKIAAFRKILGQFDELVGEALDHLAERLESQADDFGDELEHFTSLLNGWKALSRKGRKRFAGELLRSTGVVAATSAATRVGLELAGSKRKKLRKHLLHLTDLLAPITGETTENLKKVVKKASKKAKKAKAATKEAGVKTRKKATKIKLA